MTQQSLILRSFLAYSIQWQHRSWTFTRSLQDVFLAAAQAIDTNMVSGGIKYHRSLSKRFNPENEPFFISDILLLIGVKVMSCWTGPALPVCLPWPSSFRLWTASHLFSSSQQSKQCKEQQFHATGQSCWPSVHAGLICKNGWHSLVVASSSQ